MKDQLTLATCEFSNNFGLSCDNSCAVLGDRVLLTWVDPSLIVVSINEITAPLSMGKKTKIKLKLSLKVEKV